MEYTLFKEVREYDKYLRTLMLIDRNYLAYLREKDRRKMHWSGKWC